jgi:hypothetical protein
LQENVIILPFGSETLDWLGNVASILLACPACKKRISSSAHSCPHWGEPLSNEWEAKGRTERKRRRIIYAVLLVPPLLFFGSAAIVGVYEGATRKMDGQTSVTTTPARSAVATVPAFGFKLGDGQRGLFVGVRERRVILDGEEVRVLCTTDGIGQIVAAVNGAYVGVNGTARDWTQSKSLWIVQGQQLVLVQDSGFPNEVPKRFQFLEGHSDALVKIGIELCPLPPSPVVQSTWNLLQSGVRNYGVNSKNLGVTVP